MTDDELTPETLVRRKIEIMRALERAEPLVSGTEPREGDGHMAYIMIAEDAYEIDTDAGEASARSALREAGIEHADVWAGEPDGLGDSYRTGSKLFAAED